MLMRFLHSYLPTITLKNTKVHLAQHNGIEHPMDVFLEGGLWDQWSSYANSGHGGNTRIRDLRTTRGKVFAENFLFSIIETADKYTGKEEMMLKEIH